MPYYHAFQLNIKSELSLPELRCHEEPPLIGCEIYIKWGEVSSLGLLNPIVNKKNIQSNENESWVNIPNTARYLIRNGDTIIIDPYKGVDENSIRVFLLGTAMGFLLMQRNLFLLHANAIKVGEHCISFSGQSGAGKSTLSGAFIKRGYSVLADDVCAINEDFNVIPSFPTIKLLGDTCKKLGVNTSDLKRIRPGVDKFSVPVEQKFHDNSLPLKIFYVLKKHKKNTFEFKEIIGINKIISLKENAYRYSFIKGLEKEKILFKMIGPLAAQVQVIHITRPESGFLLDELLNLIQTDLSKRKIRLN